MIALLIKALLTPRLATGLAGDMCCKDFVLAHVHGGVILWFCGFCLWPFEIHGL
jgi:hypothetical protein